MIRLLLSYFSPLYPVVLVYMLQAVEYQPLPYLEWYWRTIDFSAVMKRRRLNKTKAARSLLIIVSGGIALQFLVGLTVIGLSLTIQDSTLGFIGVSLVVLAPLLWAHLIVIPLLLGRWLIIAPKQQRHITASETIFAQHPATKIAIAGSFGKTTMKELLLTVLQEAKKVAATPANKNVAISHAWLAQQLTGDEEIILIEYGEGRPGDIMRFAQTTHPDIGVITGLAPAHLETYKTLHAAGADIFSLGDYLKHRPLYVNGENKASQPFIKPEYQLYTSSAALGWRITAIAITIEGTDFTLEKNGEKLRLHSGLIGRHQVAPLALAATLALELGLTTEQVKQGLAKTQPFDHRMQPRSLGGAWIIDDTYNGNIEGIKAGLALLQELPAKRKIYVTPGLVDQGKETAAIHYQIGQLIAQAAPDRVVLMENSVTHSIKEGLTAGNYQGRLTIEANPLDFYTNLEQITAVDDLVLMQNDWTDNYR